MPDRTPTQQLAFDTLLRQPAQGIAIWQINPMEWRMIDRIAGVPEGTYAKDPIPTYRRMLEQAGCCMLDQWIPSNPLSMGNHGYENKAHETPTTGLKTIVRDGILIDSPEAVVQHLEGVVFPDLERQIASFDPVAWGAFVLAEEKKIQEEVGPLILKAPYGWPFGLFPAFRYSAYGYENYFMAYALYPEVMARDFQLQAELHRRQNEVSARVIQDNQLPPYVRLDHDMADGRGTLVSIESLDEFWFPCFAAAIEPLVSAGITCVWHCDGNLSQMIPRLIEAGVSGFQGFQYEYHMDYEAICRMKSRDGQPLLIIGGVSVTTTLPKGTPADVKREMEWLVRHAPPVGFLLGCSSSITPGVPWDNLKTLIEGFHYYRTHGHT